MDHCRFIDDRFIFTYNNSRVDLKTLKIYDLQSLIGTSSADKLKSVDDTSMSMLQTLIPVSSITLEESFCAHNITCSDRGQIYLSVVLSSVFNHVIAF